MATIPPYNMLSERSPVAREVEVLRILIFCLELKQADWISKLRIWMGGTPHFFQDGPHKAIDDFDPVVFDCVHRLAGYVGDNSWNGGQVIDENLQRTIAFFPFLHTHPFLAELSKLNILLNSRGIFYNVTQLPGWFYLTSVENKRMAMNICWGYLSLVKQHFIHVDKKTANLMHKKLRERAERLESFVTAYFNSSVRPPICSFFYSFDQYRASVDDTPLPPFIFDKKGLAKLQNDFQTMWTAFKAAVRRQDEKAKIRFVRTYSLVNPGEGAFRGLFFIEGNTDVPGEFVNILSVAQVTDERFFGIPGLMNAAGCDESNTDPESHIREQNKQIRKMFKAQLPGLMGLMGTKLELDEALVLHVDQHNELFKKAGGNGKILFSSSWS